MVQNIVMTCGDRDELPWPPDHTTKKYLEGFAAGVASLIEAMRPEYMSHRKTYDPLTVDLEYQEFKSYLFDMKSGSRSHPFSEYTSVRDVMQVILKEATDRINNEER
jgi:hypothetical protein